MTVYGHLAGYEILQKLRGGIIFTNNSQICPNKKSGSELKARIRNILLLCIVANVMLVMLALPAVAVTAPPASIGDFVWNDVNKNGIQDSGEPGIPGVTVQLLDSTNSVVATKNTDSSGKYSFT